MSDFPKRLRDLDQLADALKRHYPPRCIGRNETETQAHRYAGAVELSQRILTALMEPESAGDVEVEIS